MSGFAPGTGQGTSYYPNAIYEQSVFSTQQPSFPADNQNVRAPDASETSTDSSRECSVRGCTNPLEPPSADVLSNKKMCAPCREKHRGYASTKRARRKAEKILVSKLNGTAGGTADAPATSPSQDSSVQNSPVQELLVAPYASQPVPWAIDPVLYTQPPAQSSSSTLAGALTLQPSKTAQTPKMAARPEPVLSTTVQQNTPQYPQILTTAPQTDVSTPLPPQTVEPAATIGATTETSEGRPRFCSVKGCKATILETTEVYPYKMCQPCRTRYRNYGITKRAKWKAEREAFQRELEGLRAKEDLRRAANGLPPLVDGTDEIRAWELSIIDEQVPTGVQPDASTDRAQSAAPIAPLPARMCTVSHCHNLLPGFYRYKRCETHRIQNRWHSKLKRGREKVEKGFMLPDGTMLVTPGPIKIKRTTEPKEPKEKKIRKKREAKGKGTEPSGENPEGSDAADAPADDVPAQPIPRRARSIYSCREDDCCNLIMPGSRWRSCEPCRALALASRREKKAALKLQNQNQTAKFVNITGDAGVPSTGPVNSEQSSMGPSTAVPVDLSRRQVLTGATGGTTYPPTMYPPGYTSTSMLLTLNVPPPDKRSEIVPTPRPPRRSVGRKSRAKNPPPSATSSTNAVASSSAYTLPPQPIHGSPYPYPPPPGTYPMYMPPPGYYGMPAPPPGSAPSGQPPLMYIPSPYPYGMMPPPGKPGAAPPTPYPYYPYPLPPPGYGHPQHYPRPGAYPATAPPASYPAATPPAGGHQSPYATYKFHTTPAPPPPPAAAGSSQGYTYYQFKNGLRNPPDEQPNKRRRLSQEVNPEQPQNASPAVPPPAAAAPAPPPQVSAAPDQPVTAMEVDVPDEQRPPAPQAPPQHLCGSKTCSRVLPSGSSSAFCEKCRTKMKRRQALTKQRFKLEPKKIPIVKS
ncbi:hypothetical protein DFH06DRAFT_1207340 [Mycena polygramma]|nr:hypothetical protein DFH06DRAFT_1207340 [Mycena polygramma]